MDRWTIVGVLLLGGASLGAHCTPPTPGPCGYSPCPGPEPIPPPVPSGSRGYDPTCAGVCQNWHDLGCEEGDGTPGGESCQSVCQNVMSSGVFEWNLPCMARVTACDQIRTCEVGP